jgi:nucleoside-diphosphate-sugar epimerase
MVLITGCNSLLGRALAGRLMRGGTPVRGFDFWKLKETPETTEFLDGSILDYELVLEACEGVDTIYHLLDVEYPSHYGRRFMKRVNVKGTENLLRAARESGVTKIVYLSSSKVYGAPEQMPIKEDDAPKPNTRYGRDKLKAEKLCKKFVDKDEMDITIFRPATITGPGLDDPMILVILYMALGMEDSNRLYIAGEGDSRYQLVHTEDVVEALLAGAKAPVARGAVTTWARTMYPHRSRRSCASGRRRPPVRGQASQSVLREAFISSSNRSTSITSERNTWCLSFPISCSIVPRRKKSWDGRRPGTT